MKIGDYVIANVSPNRIYVIKNITEEGKTLILDVIFSLDAYKPNKPYRADSWKYVKLDKNKLSKAFDSLKAVLDNFEKDK